MFSIESLGFHLFSNDQEYSGFLERLYQVQRRVLEGPSQVLPPDAPTKSLSVPVSNDNHHVKIREMHALLNSLSAKKTYLDNLVLNEATIKSLSSGPSDIWHTFNLEGLFCKTSKLNIVSQESYAKKIYLHTYNGNTFYTYNPVEFSLLASRDKFLIQNFEATVSIWYYCDGGTADDVISTSAPITDIKPYKLRFETLRAWGLQGSIDFPITPNNDGSFDYDNGILDCTLKQYNVAYFFLNYNGAWFRVGLEFIPMFIGASVSASYKLHISSDMCFNMDSFSKIAFKLNTYFRVAIPAVWDKTMPPLDEPLTNEQSWRLYNVFRQKLMECHVAPLISYEEFRIFRSIVHHKFNVVATNPTHTLDMSAHLLDEHLRAATSLMSNVTSFYCNPCENEIEYFS